MIYEESIACKFPSQSQMIYEEIIAYDFSAVSHRCCRSKLLPVFFSCQSQMLEEEMFASVLSHLLSGIIKHGQHYRENR